MLDQLTSDFPTNLRNLRPASRVQTVLSINFEPNRCGEIDQTERTLNTLLKPVSWRCHGSDDPNQHQKATFGSSCRRSSLLLLKTEYSNSFIQTQTLMSTWKGCLMVLSCYCILLIFFIVVVVYLTNANG